MDAPGIDDTEQQERHGPLFRHFAHIGKNAFGNIGPIEWDQNGPGQEPLGTIFHVLIVPHGGTSTPSCYVYGPTLTLSYPKTCRSPHGMHHSARRDRPPTPDGPFRATCHDPAMDIECGEEQRRAGSDVRALREDYLSWPGRGGWIEPGAVFLLACILAVVGGGAIPGPAGTILLVLGILIALAVAARGSFGPRISWAERAGTGESLRRSGPTGPSAQAERPCAEAPPAAPNRQRPAPASRSRCPKENLSRPVASCLARQIRRQLLRPPLAASPRCPAFRRTAPRQAPHPPPRP